MWNNFQVLKTAFKSDHCLYTFRNVKPNLVPPVCGITSTPVSEFSIVVLIITCWDRADVFETCYIVHPLLADGQGLYIYMYICLFLFSHPSFCSKCHWISVCWTVIVHYIQRTNILYNESWLGLICNYFQFQFQV